MLTRVEVPFLLVFLAFSSNAISEDLGFRYQEASGRCEREGRWGLNPQFLGECGNLARMELSESDLQNISLKGAWMSDVVLSGYVLLSGNFYGAYWGRADLSDSRLDESNLSRSRLTDVIADGASFRDGNLCAAFLIQGSFRSSDFTRADLSDAVMHHGDFQNAQFLGSKLVRADLSVADLRNADFSGANLTKASLSDSNLQKARLEGANLQGTTFDRCTRLPFSRRAALKRGMVFVYRGGIPCKGP